ncbi:RNA polymerase subunit sigma-24 [Saccharospirillum sp. MSK14-1]|uniref:RNA polymerase sigma factor n=1 Tax=Saccharospirillum sp. MSK14-1 TaxID=1897632 RepID=UPI000D43E1AF|nr:RNA polymerase sigma factor [Saccharospirillum sp. MSK14-1]PTY38786.1 RNA polymerase subunit sigma-24 [Saccharospirillum sp. MSK14-1]
MSVSSSLEQTAPNASDSAWMMRVMNRVAHQDYAALKSLYDATSSRLMGVANRILKNEQEACDVLQDVYLKIWQQAGDYSGRGSVMGWLTVMTRNAALDRLKSNKRKREDLSEDPGADILVEMPASESHDLGVHQCLDQLNENAREAIVLSYIYGYSHQELHERLARPLGTIKAWIRRGLQELKKCLEA